LYPVPGPITKDDKFAFFAACNEKPVLPTCGEEGGGGATKRYNRHATKPNPKVTRRSLELLE
jgi:hypothetical protein